MSNASTPTPVLSAPVVTLLAAYTYFVTLTGAINPNSPNGGIGPSIATVTITQTIRVDGVRCNPVFVVEYDGHYQYSGVAAHLGDDITTAFRGQAIVHGYPVEAIAPSTARPVGPLSASDIHMINAQRAWDALCAAITFDAFDLGADEDEADAFQVFFHGDYVGTVEMVEGSEYGPLWEARDLDGNVVACECARIDSASVLPEVLGWVKR